MGVTTETRFSIIPEGELKEEVREWSDIEAMSRAGRLSPNTLIFLPGENTWKKLGDTALAACFEPAARQAGPGDAVPAHPAEDTEEDESLAEELRSNPQDTALLLKAAEAALAAAKSDAARGYYQRALEASPYHPRIAQEAKRRLPPAKWKSLRFLEKPPHVWDDLGALVVYPLSRGAVYFGVPALALGALFWTPWTAALALVLASLWAAETARTASRGEARPPLWDGLLADPLGRIVKPVLAVVLVAAELSVLFIAVAGALILAKSSAERDVFAVIAKSPVLAVPLCTLSVLYFPAVIALLSGSSRGLLEVCNPRRIVSAIRVMEGEYLVSVAVIALLLSATWAIGALAGAVPLLARALHGAAAVYIVLCGGFVLGRLYARFREQLDAAAEQAVSDAE